jgi:hypothetical protein
MNTASSSCLPVSPHPNERNTQNKNAAFPKESGVLFDRDT